jgi:hypothetical protein
MTGTVTRITPIDGGWAVETPFGISPLTFLSGAKAEAKAVELSRVAARSGIRAEVHIQDRSFELIAILSFEPDGAAPAANADPTLRRTALARDLARSGPTGERGGPLAHRGAG